MAKVRVLVVDDYEPFRRFVCSTLERIPELQVVCEVADGLEAVQKAEALQPDLIVLDIRLPGLNGIEAARRILKFSPNAKILFVSQDSSTEVVEEALGLGALGYVVKSHAGNDLLSAVEAVRQGRHFVSRGLAETLQAFVPKQLEPTRSHEAQFYSDDAAFLAGFTWFIEAALSAGNAVIVLVTESHQNSLRRRLQEHGVDLPAAIEQGRYIPLDTPETLSRFMAGDVLDLDRFWKSTGGLLAAAASATKGKPPRIAACGECAPRLWAQGNADAAVQLEQLWDQIAKTRDIDILCGYVLTEFQREQEKGVCEAICAAHSAVCFQ